MKTKKKFISAILTVALIICLMPGMTLTASASTMPVGFSSFSLKIGDGDWQSVTQYAQIHFSDIGAALVTNLAIPLSAPYPLTVEIAYNVPTRRTVSFGGGVLPQSYTQESPMTIQLQERDSILEFTVSDGSNSTKSLFYPSRELGSTLERATRAEGDWEYTVLYSKATITSYNGSAGHVTIPSALGGHPVVEIGRNAFFGNAVLTSVTIPNGVTHIGNRAFYDSALRSVALPDSVAVIGVEAFRLCKSLTSVTGGGGLKEIYMRAFEACTALSNINFPDGLAMIGEAAFLGCTSLRTLTIPRTAEVYHAAFIRGYSQLGDQGDALPNENLTLRVYQDSSGHKYAIDYGQKFELITGTTTPTTPPPAQEIKVLVNGAALAFDQPPIIENGRTLVPLRAIFEALGATVEWEQSTQTVTAVKDDITITLKIGDAFLTKNGERIALDVPAKIVGGRTLVPARAVAESFGADVQWDQATRTVTITE